MISKEPILSIGIPSMLISSQNIRNKRKMKIIPIPKIVPKDTIQYNLRRVSR
jgi:hypothetical protein